ncbi:MAG TPA: S53 family peptidase [Actinomycetota bacterium]|nr:S53 family peptidase [Actinomycetota bacterium]
MLRRLVMSSVALVLIAGVPVAHAAASARARVRPVVHVARTCPAPKVAGVAACLALVRTDASGRPLVSADLPSGYGPAQFHTGYDLPTTTSTPQTIAIVDAFSEPNIASDLATYNATFGLPAFKKCKKPAQTNCLAVLNQDGNTSPLPKGNVGWGVEIALDVETAHEICQNCRIDLFEADSASFADLGATVDTAASLGADVISNSYGSNKSSDCKEKPAYDHPGVAITVSAGDSGFGFGISCPANLNTVVAVGGTTLHLNSDNTWQSETVWGGTGSGCSVRNPAQAWQTAESTWSAIGCGTGRGFNDVSADASPGAGAAAIYDSYGQGGWERVGGTSLASPLIAAVFALAGNASSFPYPAQSVYLDSGADLHDITAGTNGICTPPLKCRAGSGYDLPTGVGTPKGIGAF